MLTRLRLLAFVHFQASLSSLFLSFSNLILERKVERERGRNLDVREKHRLFLGHALTGDWTHNLGMCPDQELNPQPCGI